MPERRRDPRFRRGEGLVGARAREADQKEDECGGHCNAQSGAHWKPPVAPGAREHRLELTVELRPVLGHLELAQRRAEALVAEVVAVGHPFSAPSGIGERARRSAARARLRREASVPTSMPSTSAAER